MPIRNATARGAVVVFCVAGVVLLAVGTVALRASGAAALRQELWDARGIPRDLPDRTAGLRELRLPAGLTDLRWLGETLHHLEIGGLAPDADLKLPRRLRSFGSTGEVSAVHLEWLPTGLVALRVPNANLTSWPALPNGMVEVQVAGVEELGEMPGSLRRLSVHGVRVDDLWRLPASVDSLVLAGKGVRGVEGMPASVRSLTLRDTSVRSLSELPATLERLTLVRNADLDPIDLADLPRNLVSLTLDGQVVAASGPPGAAGQPEESCGGWPCHLRTLRLRRARLESRDAALPDLPVWLSHLEADLWILPSQDALPPDLVRLHLRGRDAIDLGTLPSSLLDLTLQGGVGGNLATLKAPVEALAVLDLPAPGLADLSALPRSVTDLTLNGSVVGRLAPLPDGLHALEFRRSQLVDLPALPASLMRLDLTGSRNLASLGDVAGLPRLAELRIRGTAVESTAGLPKSLKVFDLTATDISELAELPEELEELHFGQYQLELLDGMPDSVVRLVVEDQARSLAEPDDR